MVVMVKMVCRSKWQFSEWKVLGSGPSVGGDGELQNSGKRSLSMERSSRSSLGLSNNGAKCLKANGEM